MNNNIMAKYRVTVLLLAFLAIILLFAACRYFVDKSDQIIFSHQTHLDQGKECQNCHSEIEEATSLNTSFLPKKATCERCHLEVMNKCERCHTNPQQASTYLVREHKLNFSHQKHLKTENSAKEKIKGKSQCLVCHQQAATSNSHHLAGHQECSGCHQERLDKLNCSACHIDLHRYTKKPTRFFSHKGNFSRNHGQMAKSGSDVCRQCHHTGFCSDCHSQRDNLRPSVKNRGKMESNFIHRMDWLSRHSVEARLDPNYCSKCHGSSSCQDCHTHHGIAPNSEKKFNNHPQGWVTLHGSAARRNIVSCAACHDQGAASNCVRCHKSGSIGGNPHPPGWDSSINQSNRRMCNICHKAGIAP